MDDNVNNTPSPQLVIPAKTANDPVLTADFNTPKAREGADVVSKGEDEEVQAGPSGINELITLLVKRAANPELLGKFVMERHQREMERVKEAHKHALEAADQRLKQGIFEVKIKAFEEHKQSIERENLIATIRREANLDMMRSIVLALVVVAAVVAPIVAISHKMDPAVFVQYITPITGITGTVLGYWFGRQDPARKSLPEATFRVTDEEKVVKEQP